MKTAIRILSIALGISMSLSAYAGVRIADNSKENKTDIKVQLPDGRETIYNFASFNQALYDKGIPQMSIEIARWGATDGNYHVYANRYGDVNYHSVVSTSGCEITLNGTDIGAAILSDQCY